MFSSKRDRTGAPERTKWENSLKIVVVSASKLQRFFLYLENHSLGEWFQKRLLPEDVQRKTPFARIGVRSGNCTKKQREAIRDE